MIILILVFLNLFLLISLSSYRSAQRAAARAATDQLVTLLASDGIQIDPAIIPQETPPLSRALERDADLERSMVQFLLGEQLSPEDQGGGIYVYNASNGGAARFLDSGKFEVASLPRQDSPQTFCANFCKEFDYYSPNFSLDQSGSGTATAVRLYQDVPVINCAVTFTFDRGQIIAVSGFLLPEMSTELPNQQEMFSAPAALTAFQQMRRESTAVASAITDMYLCYDLQSTTASPMTLIPSWYIETDTVSYYVNCAAGTIRRP